MALSRYAFNRKIQYGGETVLATNRHASNIRRNVINGRIRTTGHTLKEGERLDTLAAKVYKDSKYWWVIAAASGIGYAMQASHGAIIRIPNNLSDVIRLVS